MPLRKNLQPVTPLHVRPSSPEVFRLLGMVITCLYFVLVPGKQAYVRHTETSTGLWARNRTRDKKGENNVDFPA